VTFLGGDLTAAVSTAAEAAGGGDVIVFGASLAAQCIRATLLDALVVHIVPVLLGAGVRLFDAADLGPVLLERTALESTGQITDLRFSFADGRAAAFPIQQR
jgi:dihydrofolate reductase